MICIKKTSLNSLIRFLLSFRFKTLIQDFILDPWSVCGVETFIQEIEKNLNVTYSVYQNKNKSNSKTLLLLPPTGGKNILDKGYAVYFCKAGYKVFILEGYTGLTDYNLNFNAHQIYQIRFQKVISFILKKIGKKNIAVLGASAGAINFSVTLGIPKVIQNVKVFFGITTGGPLYKVVANAGEKALKKTREERMKKFKIKNMKDYEQKINENLTWDIALNKPNHLKLGLVVATEDDTVLTKFQELQVESMNPDFLLRIKSNHFGVIVKTFLFHRNKVKNFIEKSLMDK